MFDEWFAHQLNPDGDIEDGVHPDEAQALKKLLQKELTPQEAAIEITKPIQKSSDPNTDLARLWGFLADALIELPSDNLSLLLRLLQAIESLPEPDFTSTVTDKSNLPAHGTLWRKLPGFGHHYADTYQSYQYKDWRRKTTDINVNEIRALQVKKAHVEAQLVVSEIGGIPIDWGYESVTDALEQNIDDGIALDVDASAAAKWLEVAGERFRAGAAKGEESWALRRRRDLWEGKVMTWERWDFWQRRLEELTGPGGRASAH